MITILHVFRCDECGKKHKTMLNYRHEYPAPVPSVPDDWSIYEGKIYCERHDVEVDVRVKDKADRVDPLGSPEL